MLVPVQRLSLYATVDALDLFDRWGKSHSTGGLCGQKMMTLSDVSIRICKARTCPLALSSSNNEENRLKEADMERADGIA